jgi:hypothetical protein
MGDVRRSRMGRKRKMENGEMVGVVRGEIERKAVEDSPPLP